MIVRILPALLCMLLPAWAAASTTVVISEATQFGLDRSPADGSFVLDVHGALWRLPAAGGVARPLTDGLGDDRLARHSPDGRELVFQSFRDGHWGLWRMAAGGGRAEPLLSDTHDQREPVFMPDGRALLFSSDRAGQSDIWRLALAGGTPERLTFSDADDYFPAVSPDGAWLAFISERDGSPALWLQPLSGNSQPDEQGRALLSAARVGPPAFSPDGGRIALPVAREVIGFPSVARWELLLLDLASGSLEVLSATHEDVFPFAPQWDESGGVWYTADGGLRRREPGVSGLPEVLAFSISLPVSRAPEPRPVPLDLEQQSRPALGIVEPVAGPGGVVFVALGDLWLRQPDGGLVQLTDDSWVQRDPVFSPDGRQLAWISDQGGDGMQVWLRDWPEGEPRAVTAVRGGVRFPVFSPDGRQLAFQQPGPRGTEDFRVQLLDLDSGSLRRIPAPGLWPGRMGFSGDGRRLLVSAPAPPSARFRDGYTRPVWIDLAGEQPPEPLAIPKGWSLDGGVVVAADGRAVTMLADGAAWVMALEPGGGAAGDPVLRGSALVDYPGFVAGSAALSWLALDGLHIEGEADAGAQRIALAPGWVPAVGEGTTVIRAGRVFDDVTGQWRERIDIVISQGRIRALEPWAEREPGVTLIDVAGLAVLPGLIDSHAHHQGHDGEWIGRAWLGFGVTSVIEPGGLPRESRELAEAWDSGRRPGPRLFFAGPQIDGTRRYFPFAIHAASRERQRLELERADVLGYRLLKSYIRLPHEDQRWLIGQAQQRGLQLTSHELYPAVALGAGRVEHLRGTSRFGRSTKQSDRLRSYHDVATLLGATGTAIMPSIAAYGGFISYLLDHPELDEHPQYAALYPADARRALRALGMLAGRREPLLRESLANAQAGILAMHRSGATILAGTDSPIFPYGLSLVVELANYQAAGLTPAEALRSATSAPAAAIGLGGELGRIAPGYIADLIVVDGDPLEDVSELLRLRGVMRGGRWWPVEALSEPPGR